MLADVENATGQKEILTFNAKQITVDVACCEMQPFEPCRVAQNWVAESAQNTLFDPADTHRQLTELLMLVARQPILRRTLLEGGIEYEWYNQMRDPVPPGVDDDFSGLVYLVQLTNLSDYQGYRITTVAGFEVARRRLEGQDTVTRTRGFITLYAGIER